MRNYVKWDIINSYLTLPEYNELDVLKQVYNAVRELDVKDIYTKQVCIKKVVDHKADLPDGLKKIEAIAYMHNDWDDKELVSECPDCIYPNVVSTHAQQVTAVMPMLPYYFMSTKYFKKFFRLLKWVNIPFAGEYLCDSCPNFNNEDCYDTYDVIPETHQIQTHTIEKGTICISYLALPEDQDGELLIPDDARIFEIIASYIKMKYWEVEKQMADYMNYNRCNSEYTIAKREYGVKKAHYIGTRTMEGLDYDKMYYRNQGRFINLIKSRK